MIKTNKPKRRRLKVGRVIFASLILWLSILGFLSLFNKSEAGNNNKLLYKEFTISRGETLWTIAVNEQKTNDYYKNKDVQEIIYNIKKINELESDFVYENQKILIAKY